MLYLLAQTPVPQPEDFLGSWGKLGVVGFLCVLLAFVITKLGPKHVDDFRADVSKLVDAFTKALTEKEAKDAAEHVAFRELVRGMSDQFTITLKEERERCRAERAEDRKFFTSFIHEVVAKAIAEKSHA